MDGKRFPLIAAVALIAAALGDFSVESISNSGLVGAGPHDDDQWNVGPTLGLGILVALAAVLVSFVKAYRRGAQPRTSTQADWLLDVGTRLLKRSTIADFPALYATQLLVLFSIESVEQVAMNGKLSGGTVWLGGPVLFSLSLHALIGLTCRFLIGRSMRTILAGLSVLVCEVVAFVSACEGQEQGAPFGRLDIAPRTRLQSPPVSQVGGRAPPTVPAPA
jgi:hypothetical protein